MKTKDRREIVDGIREAPFWSGDALERLSQIRVALDELNAMTDEAMVECRSRFGMTWTQIEQAWGRTIGVATRRWVTRVLDHPSTRAVRDVMRGEHRG